MLQKPRLTLLSASVVALMLLGGCANIQPQSNTVLTQALHYEQLDLGQYTPNEQWWRVYQDPQLDALVQAALDNNIDLAKSTINVNKALYQARLVGAALVPEYSAGANASVRDNLKTGDASTRTFGGSVGISYEVDLWRRLSDSANAQQWAYQATVADKEATQLALVNNVVDAYYHLHYLHAAIQLNEDNLQQHLKIQQLNKTKYEAGKIDKIAYVQSGQTVLSTQNSLLDLSNQRKVAEQGLRDLLNLGPSAALPIQYRDFANVVIPKVDLEVPLQVLANRPDLRAAVFRLEQASSQLSATEKSWYPSISLSGAINASADQFRSAFNVPVGTLGVSLNLPFLNWHKIRWNIKISEADREQAQLDFSQSLVTALNEVDVAYSAYQNAQQISSNTLAKWRLDQESTRYYKIRYELGKNEFKDWLGAINTENGSALSVLNNRYQLIKQANTIYKAMAGRYVSPGIGE
ncbi:MAG: TolC family protein [Neisseriaceae bacterium]|nr:TolC family protein [Neisseriaceae bacterium]